MGCGFREFFIEAAQRDARKGVAFKSKALDDLEHGVFAQRFAAKLQTSPADYGKFLHQGILQQGEVLGDMKWEEWEVTKKALELGGINPDDLTKTTPAQRLALVGKINWQNVTLPKLKAKLGPAFQVPDDWKRQFGIAKLKNIKATVEKGRPITDPHERRLLGIWRTLEVQLAGNILPAGAKGDVGMTRLPMSPEDRKRFYKVLTGTNESVTTPLQLSPESAYEYLVKYGAEVISDDEAEDLYLTRILNNLKNKEAFIPSFPRESEADRRRWRDSAARSWGGFLPAARFYDPGNTPGFAQRITGMTTRGFKTRTNPSGRQVPYAYPEPEEFQWPDTEDIPSIKYSIDVPSQEVPDEEINAFYRSRTPEANAAVQQELVKPARDALGWLKHRGWDMDPARMDDYTQQIVMGMMNRTASVPNWRKNIGFRRATASMLARRFASQGWPSEKKERTGRAAALDTTPASSYGSGEDRFTMMRASAATARQVIQRAIASLLDTDTSDMGVDEDEFVDALDSLNDPGKAMEALDVLDRLATRYAKVLPEVRKAVDRIRRHLEPLMRRVRAD
jgi:hypothetical protein